MIGQSKILIVEDDDDLAEALAATLTRAGYAFERACDGGEALAGLGHSHVQLVLSDVRMQPMDGYELLAQLRQRHPGLPVVMMTAYGTIAEAVAALHGGARDYLEKPFDAKTLRATVARNILPLPPGNLVAESPDFRRAIELARRVARTDVTVMIRGESGTGKEVVARFIHAASDRAQGPFVAINCAAIPEALLEATLMGHEKGAFTGAIRSSPGKFEQAQKGTLLLDEIIEMPVGLQAKLLRVLQEREVERIGSQRRITLDVRILATSNRDLEAAVREGVLREDLYYRINIFPLTLPRLSARQEDIVPLAEAVLRRWRTAYGEGPSVLSESARAALLAYSWPGNVRELENVMQRSIVLTNGDEIAASALGLVGGAPGCNSVGLTGDMKQHERERIASALRATNGLRGEAAHRLGISPRTLRHKLKQFRDAGTPIFEQG